MKKSITSEMLAEINKAKRIKRIMNIFLMLFLFTLFCIPNATYGQNPGTTNNSQWGKNGKASAPVSPVNWANGNAQGNNSHYIEGQSVPNRIEMNNLEPGVQATVTFNINIVQGTDANHAFDFFTGPDRISETVDPLIDLTGYGAVSYFPFPVPNAGNTGGVPASYYDQTAIKVACQQSFDAGTPSKNSLWAYNATIQNITYVWGDEDAFSTQHTYCTVTFTPTDTKVLFAFGCHIASEAPPDGCPGWGAGFGASDIQGSPYHFHNDEVCQPLGTCHTLGQSDQQMATSAVCSPPVVNITGNNIVCSGTSTTLTSTALPAGTFSYQWSTVVGNVETNLPGEKNSTLIVSPTTTTTYRVTVHNNDNGGCDGTADYVVTVNPLPDCSITGSAICTGGSTQWCATAGMSAYAWSTGATTQCITVSTAATYSVTITDANGCKNTCEKTLVINPLPNCAITGNAAICTGGSTQWSATAGMSAYAWSTGATTQSINVSTAGTYSVTITNENGCQSTCEKTLVINPLPECSITGNVTFCQGLSIQWSATPGMSAYAWSTGATTQSITVSEAGTYSVTITNANGCQSVCEKTLRAFVLPDVTIAGTAEICEGRSIQWSVLSEIFQILWSTGATTQNITLSQAGTYSVTVTDANGCRATVEKTLVVDPLPVCSITGSAAICPGGSTQWSATAGMSAYAWSTGATTQSITVSAAATYSVTITNANGCQSVCEKTLVINPLPDCSITGNATVCQGLSTQWSATAGMSAYAWSTGATTQSINVSTAGTYSVTITNENGCQSTCEKTLVVNPLPNCAITGNASVCQGLSTQWSATAGMTSYAWSTGATTQSITVSTAGTYSVTVTNANGCQSVCEKTLVVNPLPNCAITGNAAICTGGSTQWSATAGMTSYAWSTGATTQSITVSAAATYSVTITNANGCQSVCEKTLVVNPLPNCAITGNASVCQGLSTQWSATAGMSAYAWSTGATTQSINVSTAGTYSVTITNENGCQSVCEKTLVVNPLPNCAITGNASVCQGLSTQWSATAGMTSYAWSTGATTQSITVSAAGTYSVTITNANGCQSVCEKTLVVNPLPNCAITGNAAICTGGSTQWSATAGMTSYAWSTGATTQSITVSAAGTYSVTITNANGCQSVCEKTLVVNPLPNCAITGNATVCQGLSTQWSATAGMSAYAWSTGATTQSITVSTAGTYSVTITNENGCQSVCEKTLVVNPLPNCAITGNASVCQGLSTQWSATAGMTSYAWSTGATTQSITVSAAGTYSVTITNANGCQSVCEKTLVVNPLPNCAITGNASVCQGLSTQWSATAGMTSYAWSTGATTQSINVSTAGTYSVTITNANGCQSVCEKTLVVNPLPNCAITGNASVCQGLSTQWSATAGMSAYAWSTGATTQSINVSTAGTYSVTITNENGCQNVCEKTLVVNPLPNCAITGDAEICTGTSTQWSATAGMSAYAWSTGATTQSITVSAAGTYSVTITNENGCQSVCEKTLVVKPCGNCTYTQGYFGNKNGNSCDADGTNGTPITYQNPVDLMTQLLSSGSLTVGVGGKSITIPTNGAVKLNSVMPGGTSPNELTNVINCVITDPCFNAYLTKQGRINNVLLSQTITLGLNMRLSADLSGLQLQVGTLATAKPDGGCGSKIPKERSCYYNPEYPYNLIVVNEYVYSTISASVIDALTNKGYDKTVSGLFALANDALANVDGTIGSEGGASLSDITAAIDAINKAFDGCRIFIGWDVEPCTVNPTLARISGTIPQQEVVIDQISVGTYPNPFDGNIRFEIKSQVSGQASLEILSSTGQRLNTAFRGFITAGKTEIINYRVPENQRTNLIYILRLAGKQVSGKLINIKH